MDGSIGLQQLRRENEERESGIIRRAEKEGAH